MDLTGLQTALETFSSWIWGPWFLIPLLLGTGFYLTIRLGGLQFIRLGAGLRLGLFTRKDPGSDGDISQFQALTTALAATVGTGNIVGRRDGDRDRRTRRIVLDVDHRSARHGLEVFRSVPRGALSHHGFRR